MHKAVAVTTLPIGLAGWGIAATFVNGIKDAKAVRRSRTSHGVKPGVGFNFNNDRLWSVTVTFTHFHDARPLSEPAEAARDAVQKEFKQSLENIALAFVGPERRHSGA